MKAEELRYEIHNLHEELAYWHLQRIEVNENIIRLINKENDIELRIKGLK